MYSLCIRTYTINGKTINVYACWDSVMDYELGLPADHFDVYEDDGTIQTCINDGDPFFVKPTKRQVERLVD